MKIRPLGDRILVKILDVELKTKSGIVLPDTASKEQPTIGEIIAIGDGDKVKGLKIGEKAIYSKYSGTEIKDKDIKYLILNDTDVLGILD